MSRSKAPEVIKVFVCEWCGHLTLKGMGGMVCIQCLRKAPRPALTYINASQ